MIQLVRPGVAPTSGAELESIILIARGRREVVDDIAQRMITLGVGHHLYDAYSSYVWYDIERNEVH